MCIANIWPSPYHHGKMSKDKPALSLLRGPYLSLLGFNVGLAAMSNFQSSASHLWGITEKRKMARLPPVPRLFVRAGPEAVLPSMPRSPLHT